MGIEQGQEPAVGNTRKGRAQDQVLAQLRERNRRQGRRQYLSRRLHELGPRAAAEFLGEINRHYDLDDDLHNRADRSATTLLAGYGALGARATIRERGRRSRRTGAET